MNEAELKILETMLQMLGEAGENSVMLALMYFGLDFLKWIIAAAAIGYVCIKIIQGLYGLSEDANLLKHLRTQLGVGSSGHLTDSERTGIVKKVNQLLDESRNTSKGGDS